MPDLVVRIGAGIATITISQPDRLNAMTRAMWDALPRTLDEVIETPGTRVVIVEGDGADAFSAGADISEFERERTNVDDAERYSLAVSEALRALMALRIPTIARIHGVCFGGGAAIALCCQLRFAADTLRFAIPAARLGIVYEIEAVEQLVRVSGPATAHDLLASGRTLFADEASRLRLVNRVFPARELDQRVDEYAATIVENAPVAVEGGLIGVAAALSQGDEPLRRRLQKLQREAILSEDYAEGVQAFFEKRPPRFQGR